MGNQTSTLGRDCLLSATGNDASRVAYPGDISHAGRDLEALNLNIPVVPAAITYPNTADEISNVVKCAADYGFKVQPKSGGHSYGNYGLGGEDGAVVVDLMNLKQFSMDDSTYTATLGSGLPLQDVTNKLYHAGNRAMAHGICPQVGSGGHFTIGGLGPTSRQWGSALDHIEEAEVVLANSSIVRASNTQNQDVFFAVKGAAASFGIVTEFKVRTEEAPGLGVQYTYEVNLGSTSERANFFMEWQKYVSDPNLSRKFSSILVVFEHGIMLTGYFYGSKQEFDDLGLEDRFPIRNSGDVVILTDWLGMTGHAIEDLVLKAAGVPASFYSKSTAFTPSSLMSNSTVEKLFHYLDTVDKGTLAWFIDFDLQSGATSDYPVDATAYAHRDVLFWLQSYAINLAGPVSNTTYDFLDGINQLIAEDVPGSDQRAYPGYVDPRMPNAQHRYWGSNLPRLEKIKADIDPKDVFHNPQSVKPARG